MVKGSFWLGELCVLVWVEEGDGKRLKLKSILLVRVSKCAFLGARSVGCVLSICFI